MYQTIGRACLLKRELLISNNHNDGSENVSIEINSRIFKSRRDYFNSFEMAYVGEISWR